MQDISKNYFSQPLKSGEADASPASPVPRPLAMHFLWLDALVPYYSKLVNKGRNGPALADAKSKIVLLIISFGKYGQSCDYVRLCYVLIKMNYYYTSTSWLESCDILWQAKSGYS